jgi:hypothetical protein
MLKEWNTSEKARAQAR